MNTRRKNILSIAIDAFFLAIILLMTYTAIGFIPLGVISITIIHVPVLIGAYLFGHKKGALYGLFFGLVSLLKAIESPSGILDPFFQNPLISVLPRVLFGLIAGFIFEFIKSLPVKNALKRPLVILGGFVSTLIHSVLVLGILGVLNGDELNKLLEGYYASFWLFMGITLGTSSMLEATAGGIITPIVSFPLQKYALKKYFKLLEEEKTSKTNDPLDSKIIINKISDDNQEIEIHIKSK